MDRVMQNNKLIQTQTWTKALHHYVIQCGQMYKRLKENYLDVQKRTSSEWI